MLRNKSLLLAVALLSGCGGAGPRSRAIMSSADARVEVTRDAEPYALIDVNSEIAKAVKAASAEQPSFFRNVSPGPVVIGSGDMLQVSIISTSESGFLDFTKASVSPFSTTDLPPQEVTEGGTVNVPPVGRVLARGKTLPQFEDFLARRLGEVLVNPSVVVQLVDRRSARVTLVGRVGEPGTKSIDPTEARLVDIISAAGGPDGRADELQLTLNRGGRTASVPLDQLFENPRLNIFALPGDVITVDTPNRKVRVLGAIGNQDLSLDGPDVSLVDAIARSGGVESRRAGLKGLFVYRQEPRELVRSLGADLSGFAGATVPTIFRFDFSDPSVFFIADQFEVEDGDVFFVADSLSENIDKAVASISPLGLAPPQLIKN